MKIKDGWKKKDPVTSLELEVFPGTKLDKLRIKGNFPHGNRDFWFTKDGEFDGTGMKITP